MGVFKEEIRLLEDLYKRQVQIYGDAIDYGVIATPRTKNTMRDIITSLPGMAKPIWKSNALNMIQRTYESTVEWGGGDATKVCVHYVNDIPYKKEFFTIDMRAIRVSEDN